MKRDETGWGGSSLYHDYVRSPGLGWVNRTYKLTGGIVARIDLMADQHHVGQSDLVRFLIDCALGEVEAGRLEIPTKIPKLRVIDRDWDR